MKISFSERILMYNESTVDIVMYSAFKGMGFDKAQLRPAAPIYGFGNNPIRVKGIIPFQVRLGDEEHTRFKHLKVLVVDLPIVYNATFERPLIKKMKMVCMAYYLTVKFLTSTRVGFIKSIQDEARQCQITSLEVSRDAKRVVNVITIEEKLGILRSVRIGIRPIEEGESSENESKAYTSSTCKSQIKRTVRHNYIALPGMSMSSLQMAHFASHHLK